MLSKIYLPSGASIRNENLSIKNPQLEEFNDRKIVSLDYTDLETPVLENKNENIEEALYETKK